MPNIKKLHVAVTNYLYVNRPYCFYDRRSKFGWHINDCISYQDAIDWIDWVV